MSKSFTAHYPYPHVAILASSSRQHDENEHSDYEEAYEKTGDNTHRLFMSKLAAWYWWG